MILTLLGVLYAVWYEEIKTATELQPQPQRVREDFTKALHVLWGQAVPLAIATTSAFIVFAPSAADPALQWVRDVVKTHGLALSHYDSVPVALNLASLLTLGLAVQSCRQMVGLWMHCYQDLKP